VPDAVPDVQLMSASAPTRDEVRLAYPFFVKPVRGSFSMFSARVDDDDALRKHLALNRLYRAGIRSVLRPFNELYRHYVNDNAVDVNRFIAEELLDGQQVSLDGFMQGGVPHLLGVIDAMFFPGTHAFERFQYPSALSPSVQDRMHDLTEKLVSGLGFRHGMFNVELVYSAKRDRISILEVHPRMSYQFADLYEDVDATNSYDVMLDLAVGATPTIQHRRGAHPTAASLVIRKFHGQRLMALPDSGQIDAFVERNPTARVELFAKRGSMNPEMRAMGSYRCALINVGGCQDTIAAVRRDADRSLLFDVV
jgi:biotin carboxylase